MLVRRFVARVLPVTMMALGALVMVAAQPAAASIDRTYRFETGLSGWQIGYDGSGAWSMARSTDRSYDGRYSVECYIDSTTGPGTAWMAHSYPAPMDTLVNARLTFQLWSPARSDVNQAAVVGYIGTTPPTSMADFEIIGYTGMVRGWQQYGFDRLQLTGQDPATVWVAIGVAGSWEYSYEYYMDHVTVSLTP